MTDGTIITRSVAILGGAFDPVHWGHIDSLAATLKYVDEAWMMPCFSHRFGKNMITPEQRLMMCSLGIAYGTHDHNRMQVSNFEIRNKLSGGTYEMLCRLREDCHQLGLIRNLYFVMGTDNADQIHKWRNWQRLISEFPFIVIAREGYSSQLDWYKKGPHIYIDDKPVKIASTDLRRLFATDPEQARPLTPGPVFDYIVENGLYREE